MPSKTFCMQAMGLHKGLWKDLMRMQESVGSHYVGAHGGGH
jgi:hypothetical protein